MPLVVVENPHTSLLNLAVTRGFEPPPSVVTRQRTNPVMLRHRMLGPRLCNRHLSSASAQPTLPFYRSRITADQSWWSRTTLPAQPASHSGFPPVIFRDQRCAILAGSAHHSGAENWRRRRDSNPRYIP